MYWHWDRRIDQWNKIESPKADLCVNGSLLNAEMQL